MEIALLGGLRLRTDDGRELDVALLLEASVRRSGERLRFTTLLIEAASGHHVWSERFEGLVAEWFDFQDYMAAKIIAHLALSVEAAALSGSRYKAPQRLDACDRWLAGAASSATRHRGR